MNEGDSLCERTRPLSLNGYASRRLVTIILLLTILYRHQHESCLEIRLDIDFDK
jgi:hypothetical protein